MAPKNDFELLEETGQGTLFAIRKDDPGVKYIAQPFGVLKGSDLEGADRQKTIDEASAFYNLFHSSKVGSAIAQIFNHENIISIAGHITTHPVKSSEHAHLEEYIVWDYCDASNLSALFQSKPSESTEFYLPESLCWHVLTSLLNAITYLHDGKRLFLDIEASGGAKKIWASVDQDWLPILHRAIEPRNIFFQQPRGIETYGMCKLGNFEHAVVTNHVIPPNGDVTDQDVEESPYTVADELFAVGSVIFTMMTSRQPTTDASSYLTAVQYSDELEATVRYLLNFHSISKTPVNSVLPTTMAVTEQYQQWKLYSEEGKLHRDIEDDMAARCS
ncbi:hypothetical protein MKX08_001397 [Trichoderma sp. CBMAI-0020]|nr:hypothetical protein MKX08_001397 [Trichoderma sp. CBMAI-0020]